MRQLNQMPAALESWQKAAAAFERQEDTKRLQTGAGQDQTARTAVANAVSSIGNLFGKTNTMAGHSHWAGIKHKKALVDNKRGKLWSKLSKADHHRGQTGRR